MEFLVSGSGFRIAPLLRKIQRLLALARTGSAIAIEFSLSQNCQTRKLTLLTNLFWVGGVVKLDSLAVVQFIFGGD